MLSVNSCHITHLAAYWNSVWQNGNASLLSHTWANLIAAVYRMFDQNECTFRRLNSS